MDHAFLDLVPADRRTRDRLCDGVRERRLAGPRWAAHDDERRGRHASILASRLDYRLGAMSYFSSDDPERQANIAFALVVLGIVAVGALTIWLFYGAQF